MKGPRASFDNFWNMFNIDWMCDTALKVPNFSTVLFNMHTTLTWGFPTASRDSIFGIDDPVLSGERQCFEESFARNMQCIMGLQDVNKDPSKHSIWLLPDFSSTISLAIC